MRLWRIFWRSAKLEWQAIVANPLEQVILVALPAVAVGLIWYTFSIAQVRDLPIGIYDLDHSSLSRKLVHFVDASPNVAVNRYYQNSQSLYDDLKEQKTFGALVIPKNFSKNIQRLQPSPVVFKVNAQYGTHSGIAQSGVMTAVRTFSAGVELKLKKKMGMNDKQARDSLMPIATDFKLAFNLPLSYQGFLAATAIPALLHILATVVGVGAIGRELRHKTFNRWFARACGRDKDKTSWFFSMLAALHGKLFWQTLIFGLWSTLLVIMIETQSHAHFNSLLITAFNAWLLMLLSLWLGVLVTVLQMSKRMGLSSAAIITAPAFAYSGVTFPIVSMPAGAKVVANTLPISHYLRLQLAQMQAQAPWQAALPTTYGFMIALLVLMVLSTFLTLQAQTKKHQWGKR